MARPPAYIARDFLAVLWDSPAPDEATLSRALDRLLFLSHEVPSEDCAEEDLDPPSVDGPSLYREVASRFPDLSMYPVADPLGPIDEETTLADAIDDIADLTRDLREVVWRAENLGSNDAAWYFRLMYFHWATHARRLGMYLHARQSG